MIQNEIEKKRPALFFLGIIAACATTLTAFEWKTTDDSIDCTLTFDTETFMIEPDLPGVVITLDEKLIDAGVEASNPRTATRKIEAVKEIVRFEKRKLESLSSISKSSTEKTDLLRKDAMNLNRSFNIRKMSVQDMPFTMDCGTIEDPVERFQCTRMDLSNMVRERFRFPPFKLLPDLPDRMKISFSIDVYGNISDVSMAEDTPSVLKHEIIRTFRTLPGMYPAQHNGRAIKVTFELPMTLIRE